MNKRVVSVLLWFYVGWTFGALVAVALDLNWIIGPIIGTLASALFAVGPRRLIWEQRTPAKASSGTPRDS